MNATVTLTVEDAIKVLAEAGFAGNFNCGRVWFSNAAGKSFSIPTDYRARVARAHVDVMVRAAAA